MEALDWETHPSERCWCSLGASPTSFLSECPHYSVAPTCLTYIQSLSGSTTTMLLGMSNSSQTGQYGRYSNLLWTLQHSCTGVSASFPQCLFARLNLVLKPVKTVPLNRKLLVCGMWVCSACPHGSEVCVWLPVSECVSVIPHCVVGTIWLPRCLSPFPWLSDGAAAFTLSRMSSRPTRLLVFSDISCPKTPSVEICSSWVFVAESHLLHTSRAGRCGL